MEFTLDFLKTLLFALKLASPLLLLFVIIISALGQVAGKLQHWSKFESLYWSFITAFTVGYGDRVPTHKGTKIIALIISLLGIMFTGVVVAITVEAAGHAFNMNHAIKI